LGSSTRLNSKKVIKLAASTARNVPKVIEIYGFNGRLTRELMKKEIYRKIDPLILSLSVKPNTGYNMIRQIRHGFYIDVNPSKIYPRLNDLEKMGFITREEDPYNPRNRKMCTMTSKGEKIFSASLEADRRILSYAAHLPIQPKIIDEEIENRLMKKILDEYSIVETEFLVLSQFLHGQNYLFDIEKKLKEDIDFSLSRGTLDQLIPSLLERRVIGFAIPGCPECGKPPGWSFEDGRWRLKYKITPHGERYFEDRMKFSTYLWRYMADSYIRQKRDGVSTPDWLHSKEKPKTEEPFMEIEME